MELVKVHEDKRGAIHLIENLLPDGKEFTILEIKCGTARGGCYHKVDENWIVVKGKVSVGTFDTNLEWHYYNNKACSTIATTGDSGKFEAGTAHYFHAHEDSIIIEFGVTTQEKVENVKFAPLFNIVQCINEI